MIVIVNGAFGVGKTTVVNLLRNQWRNTIVFDPERIGYVLRRLPAFVPLSTQRLGDYQDSVWWRLLTISLAARRARRYYALLMPLCISNFDYLQEIQSGLATRGLKVLHLCLTASEETVESRLRARGVDPDSQEGRWVYPRARQACAVHATSRFAAHVPTDGREPGKVAEDIRVHVERVRRSPMTGIWPM